MSNTKTIQVPLSAEDDKLIREIAKLYNISVAEWMRRIPLKEAERDRNLIGKKLEPEEALRAIARSSASIETSIQSKRFAV